MSVEFSHGWISPSVGRMFRIEIYLNGFDVYYMMTVDGVRFSRLPRRPRELRHKKNEEKEKETENQIGRYGANDLYKANSYSTLPSVHEANSSSPATSYNSTSKVIHRTQSMPPISHNQNSPQNNNNQNSSQPSLLDDDLLDFSSTNTAPAVPSVPFSFDIATTFDPFNTSSSSNSSSSTFDPFGNFPSKGAGSHDFSSDFMGLHFNLPPPPPPPTNSTNALVASSDTTQENNSPIPSDDSSALIPYDENKAVMEKWTHNLVNLDLTSHKENQTQAALNASLLSNSVKRSSMRPLSESLKDFNQNNQVSVMNDSNRYSNNMNALVPHASNTLSMDHYKRNSMGQNNSLMSYCGSYQNMNGYHQCAPYNYQPQPGQQNLNPFDTF